MTDRLARAKLLQENRALIKQAAAGAATVGAKPDHVFMDVATFHYMRGEPIPLARAQHNADGIHIERPTESGPPTWHYTSDCTEACPR